MIGKCFRIGLEILRMLQYLYINAYFVEILYGFKKQTHQPSYSMNTVYA